MSAPEPTERPTYQDTPSDYSTASSSAIDVGTFDFSFVPPEESGIPPEESSGNAFLDMGYEMGIDSDEFAMDMLYAGWFDLDADRDDRMDARQAFFDYMGWDEWQFDWDDWRDWYESTSG